MRKPIIIRTLLAILLLTFISLAVHQVRSDNEIKERNKIELQSNEAKLKLKQIKLQELNEKLDAELENKQKNQDQIKQLEEEVDRLNRDLQAKRQRQADEQERLARANPVQPQRASAAAPNGNCHDWMKQAGITDMHNGYILIMRESSCNPNAVNPSSGACGIAQALPCSKKPGQWNDPVNSMRWMQQYVMARYGSWANAVAFHDRNNWY